MDGGGDAIVGRTAFVDIAPRNKEGGSRLIN